MELETKRLLLRPWRESDAAELYKYAKDPDIGTPAGWKTHESEEYSLNIIKTVLSAPETFAVCLKETGLPVGSIGLIPAGETDMTDSDDECELGYWIGKPFWGRGLIPEAVMEVLRYAFDDIGMNAVWCGYYEGNDKSRRVQEKCGFVYQHRTEGLYVKQLDEFRTGHCMLMTRKRWEEL